MATQALTPTDFLLARVADTEVMLLSVVDAVEYHGGRLVDARDLVKAEAEAKRHVVTMLCDSFSEPVGQLAEWIIAALALPYADHDDYREEWRP